MTHAGRRIRVPERFSVVPAGPGEFRLHSLSLSIAVRDDSSGIVERVLPLLREARRVDELVHALDEFEPVVVERAVDYLLDAGALEIVPDGGADGPLCAEERSRLRPQISFFSHFTPPAESPAINASDIPRSGEDFQARLKTAHVLVLGAGQLGSQVIRDLALAGVGRLTAIDAEPVGPADLQLGGWFDVEHVGAPRPQAVQTQLASMGSEIEVAIAPEPSDGAALEALLAGATIAVLVRDHVRPAEYDLVNLAALATGTPWTSGRWAGFEFHLGPTVLPRETSCYACADLRMKSNLPDIGEYRLVEDFLNRDRLRREGLAFSPGPPLVALEVVKVVTYFAAPVACSAIYSLNILTLESRVHSVLKIPRCPACGRASQPRPTIHAWQQSTAPIPG